MRYLRRPPCQLLETRQYVLATKVIDFSAIFYSESMLYDLFFSKAPVESCRNIPIELMASNYGWLPRMGHKVGHSFFFWGLQYSRINQPCLLFLSVILILSQYTHLYIIFPPFFRSTKQLTTLYQRTWQSKPNIS